MKSKNNLPVTNNDIKDFDFTEWGKMDDIPGFINKCESMNNNLLKAIERFELILNRKESTQEDVSYLKNLDFEFKIFSFVPVGHKINYADYEDIQNVVKEHVGPFFRFLASFYRFVHGIKGPRINYYPDDVVEADRDKRIFFKSIIDKYFKKSIIAYCNLYNNKETYKWYDKKFEFKSIIILNVDGYSFLNNLYVDIFNFYIHLPFNLIQDYTPVSISFSFSDRKKIADNESDILKKKHILAEGLAKLELSLLGPKDKAYAYNKLIYPSDLKKYKKAIQ